MAVEHDEPRLVEGVILDALANQAYRVEIAGGRQVTAHVSGKMQLNFSRLLPGARVSVELSPLDATRARIVLSDS